MDCPGGTLQSLAASKKLHSPKTFAWSLPLPRCKSCHMSQDLTSHTSQPSNVYHEVHLERTGIIVLHKAKWHREVGRDGGREGAMRERVSAIATVAVKQCNEMHTCNVRCKSSNNCNLRCGRCSSCLSIRLSLPSSSGNQMS